MKHAATVALGLVVVASSARAQVSCSDPANLCTGDPCVITAVMVASPCTVDFGPRTVIIQGNLRVPAAGTLSFTAGAITLDLNSRIDGTDLSGGGAGADVTLQASGEIDLKGRGIDTSGSPGGAITVEADGMLVAGALLAAKGLNGNGGNVILRGTAGVGSARVEASAIRAAGGSIEVSSSAGPADVSGQLRAAGPDGGGTITVIGQTNVYMPGDLIATGGSGTIHVSSPAGSVSIQNHLRANTKCCGNGGTVMVDAAGPLTFSGHASVRSYGTAGSIHLSAGQSVTVGSPADLDARGSTGGTITIDGESVSVGAKLSVEGTQSGRIAGALRFHASSGDLFLAGGFHANAKGRSFQPGHGGIIEGTATGNVTARGNFRCAPDGCIAFSAGATLDTSNADFDKPRVADCPG